MSRLELAFVSNFNRAIIAQPAYGPPNANHLDLRPIDGRGLAVDDHKGRRRFGDRYGEQVFVSNTP